MNPLKAHRQKRGLTQRELSAATGIEQATISLIERSTRSRAIPHQSGATAAQAAVLARFFGHAVTEAELLYPADYTENYSLTERREIASTETLTPIRSEC